MQAEKAALERSRKSKRRAAVMRRRLSGARRLRAPALAVRLRLRLRNRRAQTRRLLPTAPAGAALRVGSASPRRGLPLCSASAARLRLSLQFHRAGRRPAATRVGSWAAARSRVPRSPHPLASASWTIPARPAPPPRLPARAHFLQSARRLHTARPATPRCHRAPCRRRDSCASPTSTSSSR
jgi:hypothetical protein